MIWKVPTLAVILSNAQMECVVLPAIFNLAVKPILGLCLLSAGTDARPAMPDADARLAALYNKYDCRPPKHLLEAARTGKSQIEIAIDTLRRQAKWNMAKADDWEGSARLAAKSKRDDAAILYRNHREDARFHRAAARRQYKEAAKLAAE